MARTFSDRPRRIRRNTPATETRPRARDRRGRIVISGPPPRAHRTDKHTDTVYSPVQSGPRCDCNYWHGLPGDHSHSVPSHLGHDKLDCAEVCEVALHYEVRDDHSRFGIYISAADIHNGWTVPDRAHTRAVLGRLTRAARALETLEDVADDLDDSEVQPHSHRRNEVWGGGYLD